MDADEQEVADDDHARSSRAAGRLDELADTAEMMGDTDSAHQWRERALAIRMAAMQRLDD